MIWPSSLFQHGRKEGAGHQKETFDIGINHLKNIFFLCFPWSNSGQAGIIQKNGGALPVRWRRQREDTLTDGISIPHIQLKAGNRAQPWPLSISSFTSSSFSFFISGSQSQSIPLGGQRFGTGEADTTGGACNECVGTHDNPPSISAIIIGTDGKFPRSYTFIILVLFPFS